MKILMIAHNASVEGSGKAFANIANYILEKGHTVITVTPGEKGTNELINDSENLTKYIIKEIRNEIYPPYKGLKNIVLFVPKLLRLYAFREIFMRKLMKIILKEKPDLIHTNTGTIRIGAKLAEELNIPHIWHIRECQEIGYNFKPFGGEKKVASLFKKSNNHCIAITESVFDYYNLSLDKDVIIYDGVFPQNITNH